MANKKPLVLSSGGVNELPAGDTVAQADVENLTTDLAAKAPLASPTFTGTVSGIDKTMVGLGNVDNTSDANKPISTATQTALDGKLANVVEDTTPQLGGMLDVNGQAIGDGTLELLKFVETASAVNEITITNAATGGAPKISATGDDANIDLELAPKGTGRVGIGTSTPSGKLQVNVSSSTGNVATWGDGQLVASVGGASNSSGVALSYDTAQNEGAISSLTPGVAWRRLNFRAEDFVFLASGGTEVARFTSGGLVLNGNATGGNITGVTLDDYEEGTWTPTLLNIGTGTYAAQTGSYTKIGDVVHAQVYVAMSTVGSASGNVVVAGLPFTSAAGLNICSSSIHANSWTTSRTSISGLMGASSTTVTLYYGLASVTASVASHADMGTGNLLFSITYKAA